MPPSDTLPRLPRRTVRAAGGAVGAVAAGAAATGALVAAATGALADPAALLVGAGAAAGALAVGFAGAAAGWPQASSSAAPRASGPRVVRRWLQIITSPLDLTWTDPARCSTGRPPCLYLLGWEVRRGGLGSNCLTRLGMPVVRWLDCTARALASAAVPRRAAAHTLARGGLSRWPGR